MHLKQCVDEPAAGEGNEAFGSVGRVCAKSLMPITGSLCWLVLNMLVFFFYIFFSTIVQSTLFETYLSTCGCIINLFVVNTELL